MNFDEMIQAMEPFKIKSYQPIQLISREARKSLMKKMKYNVFNLESKDIFIDLLTDSGTGTQSLDQWASLINPGSSNQNSSCIREFKQTITNLTGYKYVFPAHQGRSAEMLFCKYLLKKGDIVLSNSLFDTTRAHVEFSGAEGIDLPDRQSAFSGDIDVVKFNELFDSHPDNVRLVIMTCTNNASGGAPVSMTNIREISSICRQRNIAIIVDCCRFVENIYFIKKLDSHYASSSLKEIALEMFSYFDGAVMSLKKDGLSNMGGFLATNNEELAEKIAEDVLGTGSSHSYGGLTAEDARACTIGLSEVMDQNYLHYRLQQTKLLGQALLKYDIPVIQPFGGHAIYIEADKVLPHLSLSQYPAWTLTCCVYIEGGVRCVEIGNVMFSGNGEKKKHHSPREYVRLAIPRRTYTLNQLLYVADVFGSVIKKSALINGMRIIKVSSILPHFTAELEPEGDELIAE